MNIVKNTFAATLAVLMLAVVAVPAVDVHAQNVSQGVEFCRATESAHGAVDARADELVAKVNDRWSQYQSGREAKQADLQARAQELSAKWFERKNEAVEQLNGLEGLTDAQVSAVADFNAAADAARAERDASYDAATQSFRTGIESESERIRADVIAKVESFRDSVKAELQAARDRCERGEEMAANKSALQSGLQAARAAFDADRASLNIQGSLSGIINDRATATEAAAQGFRAAMREAGDVLKAEF